MTTVFKLSFKMKSHRKDVSNKIYWVIRKTFMLLYPGTTNGIIIELNFT